MSDYSPQAASCRLIPLLDLVSLVERALEESGSVSCMHLVLPPASPGGKGDRLVCGRGAEVEPGHRE